MALPGDELRADSTGLTGTLLSPEDISVNKRTSYELGGIDISDASQGLEVQVWKATQDSGNAIILTPLTSGSPYNLITLGGVASELSLAFDQNMRPSLAYVLAGQAYLYWYDSLPADFVTTALASDVRSPMLNHDDKRAFAVNGGTSDILLFYIRGSSLFYRQQRERYTVERQLATFAGSRIQIRNVGMNSVNRLQVEIIGVDKTLVSVP